MMTETSIYEYAKQGLSYGADRTALWFYGKSISFSTLFEKIDNVADHLYQFGVRQGTVVTIHLPNCPQAVMAIYAVAKLGGICNMVHPLIPIDGLRQNMEFVESEILITGSHFERVSEVDFASKLLFVELHEHMGTVAALLYQSRNKVSCPRNAVDYCSLEVACNTKAETPRSVDLAQSCVCYLNSSGTTSAPKTVIHSHAALNNWVENARGFFRDTDLSRHKVLSVLPVFHGSGLVLNIHQVLSSGGEQFLMASWNPGQAARLIKRHSISILTGVPKLYQDLLDQKGFCGTKIQNITQCFVSGDYVPYRLKQEFNTRVGRQCLFEGYGMTEIVTACFSNAPYREKMSSSGYPLENCHIAILNEKGELQLAGRGELVVSTNTMMIGYLKDTEGTDASFFEVNGQRWLRTGDEGEIDEQGFVYFLERRKNVIVRKGYNIYPGEIEAVVREVNGVDEVCAVGVPDPTLQETTEQVRVCIVLRSGFNREEVARAVRTACQKSLPRYATVAQIRFLDHLPRNQMNKIDRTYLRQLP